MTVDEYLAWAEGQPGRYELYAGTVYAMAPERAIHASTKFRVQTALLDGIRKAGVACHMLPDGMTVRIDRQTAHEPGALVYCGSPIDGVSLEVPNPVIVVEVLSPSTRHIDASLKLDGYFSVQSIQHYLIINPDPDKPMLIHHSRGHEDAIVTKIMRHGTLRLVPPGINLVLGDIFPTTAP
jgi:Uma2 family endonuclease